MKKLMIAVMVIAMSGSWAMPAFAHHRNDSGCQNYAQNYNYEACQETCEGGVQCGTNGHYCEQHRSGSSCAGEGCQASSGSCHGHSQGHHHGC